MNIAIFPQIEKEKSVAIAKKVIKFLKKNTIQIITEDFLAPQLDTEKISSFKKPIHMMISIGGDGSILHLIHKYSSIKAPILGINLGQIGFMADIPVEDLHSCLQDIIEKKFSIEKRIMIEASIKNKKFLAINEILLHRECNPNLIEIEVFVDKKYLSTFSADGLIIATPNGSTAYSLSSGGPILTPDLDVFVITPICPHTISVRPIVINSSSKIRLKYLTKSNPIIFKADGINSEEIKKEEIVEIQKSKNTFDIIKLDRHNYFDTLNSKLGWSGKILS